MFLGALYGALKAVARSRLRFASGRRVRRMASMPEGQASAEGREGSHGKRAALWRNVTLFLSLVWAPWQHSPYVSVKCSGFLAPLTWQWTLNDQLFPLFISYILLIGIGTQVWYSCQGSFWYYRNRNNISTIPEWPLRHNKFGLQELSAIMVSLGSESSVIKM